MKTICLTICLLLVASAAWAVNATVIWTEPTTNEDGSPLTDLSHYELDYSMNGGTWTTAIVNAPASQHTITGLGEGDLEVKMRSVDTSGNKSVDTPSAYATIQLNPSPPTILDIIIQKIVAFFRWLVGSGVRVEMG